VDYEIAENEDEFQFSDREIVINGNHPAYKVAAYLDGKSGMKYEIGDAALSVRSGLARQLPGVNRQWAEAVAHPTLPEQPSGHIADSVDVKT
jgi:hypothetical protein